MNKSAHIQNIFSSARVIVFTSIILSLLLTIEPHSFVFPATAQSPCGDTYIVLPEDTLENIANLCGTTVEEILKINPEITDPNNLYPGEIIRIPDVEAVTGTIVTIGPSCGLAGQSLLVVGSGFPQNTNVSLSIGQIDQNFTNVGDTISDQFGRIDTTVVLPSNALPNTEWVVIGEAQISSAKFTGTSNNYFVISQTPDPNSSTQYIARQGDTLQSIAEKFVRALDWLREANPRLSFSAQLVPGDTVQIPLQEPGTPKTTINPICGPAETDIMVSGTAFPPTSAVQLSIGQYLSSYEPAVSVITSSNRIFQTQMVIPGVASVGAMWVVVANTNTFPLVRSISNIFTITPPKDPKSPQLYIVEPGDTLNQISAEFGRIPSSILAANPQITNPNVLEIGEKIIIPGQKEEIIVSPISGAPLSLVQAVGFGFQPSSSVTIGLARNSIIYRIEGGVPTDINGNFQQEYTIPSASLPGDTWSVVALKLGSNGDEVVAKSNDFTVTSPQAPLLPDLTIWPLVGPTGTLLTIVGNNFPSNSEILYSFGISGGSPFYSSTTWTEINGTFAVDLIIPASAEEGEIWDVNAEVMDDPTLQATSPGYLVIEP